MNSLSFIFPGIEISLSLVFNDELPGWRYLSPHQQPQYLKNTTPFGADEKSIHTSLPGGYIMEKRKEILYIQRLRDSRESRCLGMTISIAPDKGNAIDIKGMCDPLPWPLAQALVPSAH